MFESYSFIIFVFGEFVAYLLTSPRMNGDRIGSNLSLLFWSSVGLGTYVQYGIKAQETDAYDTYMIKTPYNLTE